ncbi:hypothetical protein N7474_005839 [Penicillium riverlandense]|uniref:uncharacterized protein n=1 Tax=Penicillium riverlandense TaxID=1903569 RepID=UPI0025473846|nr:uncharacterized protein N7474_005839 [Penicillium riverlandense]KAJ5820248.1 hypothetical protein N7474_005839 [Penicillium riverlandense]
MSASINAADLFNVDGLVAVITGGGSGIGLMMAKALAANGASKVFIVGRRFSVLESAAKESKYGNIIPLLGDVTSKGDLKSITAHVDVEAGHVDLLIANAGISGPDLEGLSESPSIEELQQKLWGPKLETFANTYTVNTAAIFYTVVAFLRLLDKGNKKRNGGPRSQVVATSSISGFNRNVPGGFAYGGSKAATTHMMKQFATLLAPYGIRSNIIAPGIYPSEMTAANMAKQPEETRQVFPATVIPEERMGDEQDVAGAILFLASRAGAYCNGNVLVTDGGRLSVTPASY